MNPLLQNSGYSGFFHQLQLASHDLAAIWQKVTKNEIKKIHNSTNQVLSILLSIHFN